jgi:hypothetical protein
VSSRHLSFLETGRAQPSRQIILFLGEHLDIPLPDRNDLLLAAGFAPAYGSRSLDDPAMAGVRDSITRKGDEGLARLHDERIRFLSGSPVTRPARRTRPARGAAA